MLIGMSLRRSLERVQFVFHTSRTQRGRLTCDGSETAESQSRKAWRSKQERTSGEQYHDDRESVGAWVVLDVASDWFWHVLPLQLSEASDQVRVAGFDGFEERLCRFVVHVLES